MTTPRPQRKPARRLLPACFCLVFAVLAPPPDGVRAGTTERVVADWRTGLAIGGFDPVAYFTDAAPVEGRPEYEASFAGVTWRFRNEGNRAAFLDHPEIYAPQFGGHDPVGVARGIARPGHPELWLVEGRRLYLFFGAEARAAFAADPAGLSARAQAQWPRVLQTLSP
ncbi:MAG: YHS domain-containing (seleno)protein [Pseudorhodoplanes sp.]